MPLLVRQDDLLLRLVKDVTDIRSALRRVVSNLPLYDIANEDSPVIITADQNDYVPGNFDVLRIITDAPHAITGFRGGVKGRFLRLFNVGNFEITIPHMSTLSLDGNRVFSSTGFDIVINAGGQLVLYYDSVQTRWISSYSSNADRISCRLRMNAPQSIPDGVSTALLWTTILKDTGSFFNIATPGVITIPETGWYQFSATVLWDYANLGDERTSFIVNLTQAYILCVDSRMMPVAQATITKTAYALKGDQLSVYAFHLSAGSAINVSESTAYIGVVVPTEFSAIKM
jgi:hypothetical protein